ncbi:MAG: ParB N-terminal domain-containing protein [Patescibacteria group bacterium]|nr:ParB N-terminal domain-containing protein [Patescibacteria group bacterium]
MTETSATDGPRSITLPGGDVVSVSDDPEEWWSKHNATGFVDPHYIAPDPKNPRRRLNPARQKELEESIKARGVRQALILTPRHCAPWAPVEPQYKKCFFLAVGGHRRRAGSIATQIGAVPVMVKIYPSEKEHRMDVSLLNKGQDDLTPLEEGEEMMSLQSLGWKVEELCEAFGYATPQLYDRMHLTKLDPRLQKWLDPELPRRQRIPITLGGTLGGIPVPTLEELVEVYDGLNDTVRILKTDEYVPAEKLEDLDQKGRRFALQRLLFAVIQRRNLPSPRAIEFIRDRKLKLAGGKSAGGRPTQRYRPNRRKDVLDTVIKEISSSLVVDWPEAEWQRIFGLAPREEVEDYMKKVQNAQKTLTMWESILGRIRDSKKATRPEVLEILQRKKAVGQ